MRESDIKWESESGLFWIGKTRFGYTLHKHCGTHSKGFLTFGKLPDAIDNGKAFEARPETADKLMW